MLFHSHQKAIMVEKKKIAPLLKGQLSVCGSEVVFEGMWGMTPSAFQSDTTVSIFRYAFSVGGTSSTPDDKNTDANVPISPESVVLPVSGMYSGAFELKNVNPTKPPSRYVEKNVHIAFKKVGEDVKDDQNIVSNGSSSVTNSPTHEDLGIKKDSTEVWDYKVEGNGRNRLGWFQFRGLYDSASKRLHCVKVYVPKPTKPKAKKKKTTSSKSKSTRKVVRGARPQAVAAILRGTVSRVAGTADGTVAAAGGIIIEGKWAMNAASLAAGTMSSFRHVRISALASTESDSSLGSDSTREICSRLSGLFNGSFVVAVAGGAPANVAENGLEIRFSPQKQSSEAPSALSSPATGPVEASALSSGSLGTSALQTTDVSGVTETVCLVEGLGSNAYGKFTMKGTYTYTSPDGAGGKFECSKTYTAALPRPRTRNPSSKARRSNSFQATTQTSGRTRPSRKSIVPAHLRSPPDLLDEDKVGKGPIKRCAAILKQLMEHQWAGAFNAPVDWKKFNLLDYPQKIRHPMDFGTVRQRLVASKYKLPVEFATDVRLVFSNAFLYNAPGSPIFKMAKGLDTIFERRFEELMKKLRPSKAALAKIEADKKRKANAIAQKNNEKPSYRRRAPPKSAKRPRSSDSYSRSRPSKRRPNDHDSMLSKMREQMEQMQKTINQLQNSHESAPRKRSSKKRSEPKPLSFDEKRALSVKINELPGEKLTRVLQIISARLPIEQQGSDEIEIDIDSLDTATLRELQKYCKTCSNAAAKRRQQSLKNTKGKQSGSQLEAARRASAGTQERIRELEAQLLGGNSGVSSGMGLDSDSDSDVSDSDGGEVIVGAGMMGNGMGIGSFYD